MCVMTVKLISPLGHLAINIFVHRGGVRYCLFIGNGTAEELLTRILRQQSFGVNIV